MSLMSLIGHGPPIVVRGKLLKSGEIFLLLIQELLTPDFIGLEAWRPKKCMKMSRNAHFRS